MWGLVAGLWNKFQLYVIIGLLVLGVLGAVYALGGSHAGQREAVREMRQSIEVHENAQEAQQDIDRSSDSAVRERLRDRWTAPE